MFLKIRSMIHLSSYCKFKSAYKTADLHLQYEAKGIVFLFWFFNLHLSWSTLICNIPIKFTWVHLFLTGPIIWALPQGYIFLCNSWNVSICVILEMINSSENRDILLACLLVCLFMRRLVPLHRNREHTRLSTYQFWYLGPNNQGETATPRAVRWVLKRGGARLGWWPTKKNHNQIRPPQKIKVSSVFGHCSWPLQL